MGWGQYLDVSFDRVMAIGGNRREKGDDDLYWRAQGDDEVSMEHGVTRVTMICTVGYGVIMMYLYRMGREL